LKSNISGLKPEFSRKIEQLKVFIFNRIQPKKIDGVSLSGPEFLTLANTYITSINEGSIPNIPDAWTSVVETQTNSAGSLALKSYKRELHSFKSKYCPTSRDELSNAHA
jgi:hypothetical protein